MVNGLQPWHVIILVVVIIVLFGAKKLPDAARSLGNSRVAPINTTNAAK